MQCFLFNSLTKDTSKTLQLTQQDITRPYLQSLHYSYTKNALSSEKSHLRTQFWLFFLLCFFLKEHNSRIALFLCSEAFPRQTASKPECKPKGTTYRIRSFYRWISHQTSYQGDSKSESSLGILFSLSLSQIKNSCKDFRQSQ